jgi:type IV pilus assembly protein PilX
MNMRTVSVKSQSGVVLIVGLIMLMLLTLIGVSGLQSTGLEEKMAGNQRDSNMAFQAAESALRAGEAAVLAAKPDMVCPGTNTDGYYAKKDYDCNGIQDSTEVWESVNWSASASPPKTVEFPDAAGDFDYLSEKPRYIVEYMETVCRDSSGARVTTSPCTTPNSTFKSYRITARAKGGSDVAIVVLQSIYEVPS